MYCKNNDFISKQLMQEISVINYTKAAQLIDEEILLLIRTPDLKGFLK